MAWRFSNVKSNYSIKNFAYYNITKFIYQSCENSIVLWKPGLLHEDLNTITRTNKNVSIIHKLLVKECDIWYVRFAIDLSQKVSAKTLIYSFF